MTHPYLQGLRGPLHIAHRGGAGGGPGDPGARGQDLRRSGGLEVGSLLTLPAFTLFLDRQQRNLRRLVAL